MTLKTSLDATPPHPHAQDLPQGALRPGDSAYEAAVQTLTGTGTPDLVIVPETAQEVATGLTHAREHGLPVTVRAGGHSIAGLSTPTGGLLLDLRRLDHLEVDAPTRLVRIGGGASWGDVAEALGAHSLGLTAGDTAGVGVGGLTLGGGIGWMVRRHGLAIDNLVGAQVVTADGQVREVSADQDAELFWALRGGGAGLGVVTRFDFVAQQVTDVVFGQVVLALEDPLPMLTGWRDLQLGADERLTTTLSLAPAMGADPPVAVVGLCFAGPLDEAGQLLDGVRALGQVLSDDVAVRPYAEVLATEKMPPGLRMTMRNTLVPELGEEVLADVAALLTGPTMVSLRALGGAFSRVEEEATAFPGRAAQAVVMAMRLSAADAPPDELPGWERVAGHGSGPYGNFLSSREEATWLGTSARDRRLAALRARLDPTGLFAADHIVAGGAA